MSMLSDLIDEIEGYAKRRGIKETTFGRLAADDGKFVGRLRDGKGVTIATVERVRKYMRDNPAPPTPTSRSEAA